ncbi:MAG TPA: DedA family protein [Candidatus Limnocylindria bacterium]|nr:DedA family protein [Candidatus Limnocylindria bacterium]
MLDAIDRVIIPFLEAVYATVGYLGLAAAMAVENAFFFLPVPSEIVLPLAGFAVARGVTEPLTGAPWTYWIAVLAAVAGTTAGSLLLYGVALVGGRPLLERYGRYVLIDAHDLDVADRWFARYGDFAVFIARVVPIVRSVISIPAGVSRMPLWRFTLFSALGTIPWCMLLVWLGMVLGERWSEVSGLLRPAEYAAYAIVAAAIALFLWRQLRRT